MNICTGKFKQELASGRLLVSASVNIMTSTAAVEIYHEAGYDMLMIDLEHSALTIADVSSLLRVARAFNMPCMVRVATPDYDNLNRVLDQGADGVFVPRVRSAEEVRRIVDMIRYPPEGQRGLAGYGCPASKYGGWSTRAEQVRAINENTVLGIQIETREALDGLEEILAVPGVDVAVVGCDDLSTAMGIPGDLENPRFQDAADRVIGLCLKHGVAPGIPCPTPKAAREWVERGMRMLWYGIDTGLLWEGATRRLNGLRKELAGTKNESLWKKTDREEPDT